VQLGGGDGQGATSLGETLGLLGAFVALAGVGGLLLVPWLLRRMSISADEELQTLGIAALLFALAVVAQHAGYSLALGAFLLGTIVAETPHRHQVERTFEGMRDVFSAVFFVAIGMQIDVHELVASGGLIAGVALFTLLARFVASTTALVLIGTAPKEALRTGMAVTPIGEFSFIIAQLGVTYAVVPRNFYPLAVGVSLLTTLVAPALVRRSAGIADALLAHQPGWLVDALRFYRDWLDHLQAHAKRNKLWQLSRKRFFQVVVEVMLVTGLLVFSGQMFAAAESWLGRDLLFPNGLQVLFWGVLCLVLLAPLVAIWRNCSALALLYSQVAMSGRPRADRLAPMLEAALKSVSATAIFIWLFLLLPAEGSARWLLLATVLIAVVVLGMLWRKLVFWHSQLEVELKEVITSAEGKMTATSAPWLQAHGDWNLHMVDCVLPDLADAQGRKISELDLRAKFGCSVVGIERQGFMIPLPSPDAVLYPRDRVLLMGTTEQIKAGQKFLGTVSGVADSLYEELLMESVKVPLGSRATGRSLAELQPARVHGVQVAGVNRRGLRILNPSADERLYVGDEVLVLGAPAQIRDFKVWLSLQEGVGSVSPI
jgi:CPA2 family monovalent cation:H+ antiporter-2